MFSTFCIFLKIKYMQTIEYNKTQVYKYLFSQHKKTVQALFIIVCL